MKQKRYETRMVLTVPTRGIITIEGSQEFVRKFFDDVRSQFVHEVSAALKYDPAMKGKDFDVVETHHGPKETSLSVVEKTGKRVAEIREWQEWAKIHADKFKIGALYSACNYIDYLLSLVQQPVESGSCWLPLESLTTDSGWVLAAWDDYAMNQAESGVEELPYANIGSRVEVITAYFARHGVGREHLTGWLPCPDPPIVSGPTRCGACGHNREKMKDGICVQPALGQEAGAGYRLCGCKCISPATGSTSEQGEVEPKHDDDPHRWEIEPHPYQPGDYDFMITDSDRDAVEAIQYAAEMFLWDGHEGGERILKVRLNPEIASTNKPATTSAAEGGERETWLPYVHETCPREIPVWLAFPSGNVLLKTLGTKPFFWFEDDPTHYMIAKVPTSPATTAESARPRGVFDAGFSAPTPATAEDESPCNHERETGKKVFGCFDCYPPTTAIKLSARDFQRFLAALESDEEPSKKLKALFRPDETLDGPAPAGVEAAAIEIADRWIEDELTERARAQSQSFHQLRILAEDVIRKHCNFVRDSLRR